MSLIPLETTIEAKYADGFILSETELDDVSPYNENENVLRAVLNKDPDKEHGPMVLFTVFYNGKRYDIDWTKLPSNARPIRFRDGNMSENMDTMERKFWWSGCRMGYQYNDINGKNIQQIMELQ